MAKIVGVSRTQATVSCGCSACFWLMGLVLTWRCTAVTGSTRPAYPHQSRNELALGISAPLIAANSERFPPSPQTSILPRLHNKLESSPVWRLSGYIPRGTVGWLGASFWERPLVCWRRVDTAWTAFTEVPQRTISCRFHIAGPSYRAPLPEDRCTEGTISVTCTTLVWGRPRQAPETTTLACTTLSKPALAFR